MDGFPLFSIIIPTYNAGETLASALKSILNQSFNDYEVLIIDGVSTDDTLMIARGFNDNRVKIYSESDKGIHDAMNKGITKSKGEWLYFLGSDDLLFDNTVLKYVSDIVKAEKYDVVYGNVISPCFDGVYDGEFNKLKIKTKNICHQSIFFRKDVFKIIGHFDLYFKVYADWDKNFRWLLIDKIKSKYIDIIVASYGEGGFSARTKDLSFKFLRNWRYQLAQKHNISMMSKFVFFYQECRKLYLNRRGKDLLKVISELPKFIYR